MKYFSDNNECEEDDICSTVLDISGQMQNLGKKLYFVNMPKLLSANQESDSK